MLMEEFAENAKIAMYHMACNVNSDDKDVTFLYKFKKGTCPKSHGMNVAKMAGLPPSVVSRADEMSKSFEKRLEMAHGRTGSDTERAHHLSIVADSPFDAPPFMCTRVNQIDVAAKVWNGVVGGDLKLLRTFHSLLQRISTKKKSSPATV